MITIPQNQNSWTQPNISDIEGDIWASFNLDLTENVGKVRLGKRLIINTNSDDVSDITSYPVGFKAFNGIKFTVAGSYVFSQASPYPSATSFAKVTAANAPTNCDSTLSDIEVSNSCLYVTSNSNSVYWTQDGATWNSSFTAGTSDSNVHLLASYNGRTYMTRAGSQIISWDSSNTVATSGSYTCELGNTAANRITFIKAVSDGIWIGVVNTQGGKGYIYKWDGVTANTTKTSYKLNAIGALSCVIEDDVPYVMDTNGSLLAWNGGTFKKLASLYRRTNQLLYNPASLVNDRFIHPNGMSVIKGKINILIDGRLYNSTNSLVETIPSGIYEYDEDIGLYHKHSFTMSHVGDSITGYGALKLGGVGGLAEQNLPNTSSTRNGLFLAGAKYYSDATTLKSGIFYDDSNDTLQKGGYFITKKITADDGSPYHLPAVENTWASLYTIYRKLLDSGDKIIPKYRTTEQEPTEISITWTSANTFTTTTNILGLETYEVEILQGIGAGKCSHITKIDISGSTYTVTVDETYTGASNQTAKARIQNWKKISTISPNNQSWNSDSPGIPSTWIQFKFCMIFTGRDEIERIILTNTNSTPAK